VLDESKLLFSCFLNTINPMLYIYALYMNISTIAPVPASTTIHASCGPAFAVPTLGVPWSFFFFVSSVGRLRVCNPAIYRGPHATLILGLRNASWWNRTRPNGQV